MYELGRKVVKFFSIFSILLTIAFLVYLVRGLDILHNPNAFAHSLRNHLLVGTLVFLLLQIIQVVIPIIPGGVTTVVGFMAFGPFLGFILNYVGIIIGSIILFALTRHFGKMFILLFIDDKAYNHYERKLFSPTYERFFILNMLSPISPADILVMITGLSKMSYRKFILIILLAKPISILAYSYFWIYGGKLFFK
ncbi:VTT domain-containing protein [Streptococcus orisratti]|uniref:VTT domain-containing protein n=1 Tax=Streptococcus orisratti TaxID=114652 RepID=UPI000381D44D|nr:VTT domain-containing protein [Streptococcus orisratti]